MMNWYVSMRPSSLYGRYMPQIPSARGFGRMSRERGQNSTELWSSNLKLAPVAHLNFF